MPLLDTDHPMPMAFVPAGEVRIERSGTGTGVHVSGGPDASANITRGYFVTETLLTRGQFSALFPEQTFPPVLDTCTEDDCPMGLQAAEIAGVANALSELEGLEVCYEDFTPSGCDPLGDASTRCSALNIVLVEDCEGYRLGSGVEWLRAAWGESEEDALCALDPECLDDLVWWSGNSEDTPRPVRGKPAGPWGIYDMFGNYSERVHHLGGIQREPIPNPVPDDYIQTSRMGDSSLTLGGHFVVAAIDFRRRGGIPFEPTTPYENVRDERAGVRFFRTAPDL